MIAAAARKTKCRVAAAGRAHRGLGSPSPTQMFREDRDPAGPTQMFLPRRTRQGDRLRHDQRPGPASNRAERAGPKPSASMHARSRTGAGRRGGRARLPRRACYCLPVRRVPQGAFRPGADPALALRAGAGSATPAAMAISTHTDRRTQARTAQDLRSRALRRPCVRSMARPYPGRNARAQLRCDGWRTAGSSPPMMAGSQSVALALDQKISDSWE